MDEWLKLAEMVGSDRGDRLPVPVGRVSNGEFPARPPDDGQRMLKKRLLELADLFASRLRMNRREFLGTSCGLAAAFLAINSIHGPLFAVSARPRQPIPTRHCKAAAPSQGSLSSMSRPTS